MSLNEHVTIMLNSAIDSLKTVLPIPVAVDQPTLVTAPFNQETMSVLIGVTGNIRGRILFDGNEELFSQVGAAMFGMPISNDMLDSFAGELGNMIAGNLSTFVSQKGLTIDITPPTVIVGDTKLYGFDKALRLPVKLEDIGTLTVVLMLELQKENNTFAV